MAEMSKAEREAADAEMHDGCDARRFALEAEVRRLRAALAEAERIAYKNAGELGDEILSGCDHAKSDTVSDAAPSLESPRASCAALNADSFAAASAAHLPSGQCRAPFDPEAGCSCWPETTAEEAQE